MEEKPPTVAQLAERIDNNLKATMEEVIGRPFTEGTVDDFREALGRHDLRLIDCTRERHYVDERVYSQACYERGYYRLVADYMVKVCKENGFDFLLPVVPTPTGELVSPLLLPPSSQEKVDAPQTMDILRANTETILTSER